jgi:hypothetical protein
MVEALEARDGPRLATILRSHLTEKCQAVLEGRRAEREAAERQAAATVPAGADGTDRGANGNAVRLGAKGAP